MRTKKGMLLASETLKIVIAVISIGFLVYFLTSLYFNNINGQKLAKAEVSLNGDEGIMGKIVMVNQNGVEKESHVQNPSGWSLMSFTDNEVKPNACAGENCLCICKNIKQNNILWVKDRQAKACNEKGVCGIVENLKEFEKIEIKGTDTFVVIKKVNDLIEISKK